MEIFGVQKSRELDGGRSMSFKIAVVSNDGQNINEHFGRARHFLIFDLVDKHFKLVEVREIISPHCDNDQCEHHDIDHILEALEGCHFILASQIGPGAIRQLESHGIKGFAISGSIDQITEKLLNSYEVKNYLKSHK